MMGLGINMTGVRRSFASVLELPLPCDGEAASQNISGNRGAAAYRLSDSEAEGWQVRERRSPTVYTSKLATLECAMISAPNR